MCSPKIVSFGTIQVYHTLSQQSLEQLDRFNCNPAYIYIYKHLRCIFQAERCTSSIYMCSLDGMLLAIKTTQ